MSKELTEQWRNGKLNDGWYYILFDKEKLIGIDGCTDSVFWHTDNKILKILSKAPDYDQFVELTEKANQFSQLAKKVEELNAKCSQLEKKVKKRGMQINRAYDRYIAKRKESSEMVTKCNRLEKRNAELVTKIHRLEKQLDVAVKTLEVIERMSDKFDNGLGFIELKRN